MMLVTEDQDDRVMVFVDLAKVSRSVANKETAGRLRLDYSGLAKEVVGNRRLMGAYVFDSISAGENRASDAKRRLHDALRYQGFRVVTRDVSYEEDSHEVDVALATEMLSGAFRNAFDVAILVSGDRDFVPAVERVRAEGKRVEVAFFGSSRHLQKVADRVHELDTAPILRVLPMEASE